MKSRLFALASVLTVALVPAAHGTVRTQRAAGPQTTDPTEFVRVNVKITDSRIYVDPKAMPRGNYARFIVRNVGKKIHNFTLGKQSGRGTGVQTGFTQTVKPRQEKILLLYLDYRGKLPYYSRIEADLQKPGMKGIFTIL